MGDKKWVDLTLSGGGLRLDKTSYWRYYRVVVKIDVLGP